MNKKNNYFDSPAYKNKVIKNKKSYVGRTYKVQDNDLPHKNENSNKTVNFAVVEENGKFLGGIRTTTQNTKNAHPFKNKHRLYKGFKTFFEIDFNDGSPIRADDERLKENPWLNNLTFENIDEIRNTIFEHSMQSTENKSKRDKLKTRNKKSRH